MKEFNSAAEFRDWLAGLVPQLRATLQAGALHLRGKLAQYPPQAPPVNPDRGYTRGQGPWYRRTDGSIRQYKTSEDLGPSWTIAEESDGGLTQTIGNDTSYGPWVQGATQTGLHAAHGWQTVEQVAEKETPTVLEFIRTRLIELLGGTA